MRWGDGRGGICVCVFVLILQVACAEPQATPETESRGFCPETRVPVYGPGSDGSGP